MSRSALAMCPGYQLITGLPMLTSVSAVEGAEQSGGAPRTRDLLWDAQAILKLAPHLAGVERRLHNDRLVLHCFQACTNMPMGSTFSSP